MKLITRFIVSVIDTSDTSDGRPRVLAHCMSLDEAKAYVKNDIQDAIDAATDDNGQCTVTADFDDMSTSSSIYNIEKKLIDVYDDELA